ncbi:SMI1/KNR4 family protein [Streptomyces olivaceoviridis]|uniref:SMI1/KNR4 family protein n=2 Tax=Streptomyces olivaceoviridis TaxID=1921 RepID=UPI0037AA7D28
MPPMPRFEDLLDAFWDGSTEYGVQPPVTDQLVQQAEQALNAALPASLPGLLRQRNGGRVAAGLRAFPTSAPTSWADDHVPFEYLMGIGQRDRTLSLLDSAYLIEEWGLPTSLVLLSSDGPCWIGLDYRTGPTPHGRVVRRRLRSRTAPGCELSGLRGGSHRSRDLRLIRLADSKELALPERGQRCLMRHLSVVAWLASLTGHRPHAGRDSVVERDSAGRARGATWQGWICGSPVTFRTRPSATLR